MSSTTPEEEPLPLEPLPPGLVHQILNLSKTEVIITGGDGMLQIGANDRTEQVALTRFELHMARATLHAALEFLDHVTPIDDPNVHRLSTTVTPKENTP